MIKLYENFINPKIDYYSNSQKKSEEWKVNGEIHREDGPAIQFWYENGQKWIESWLLNGYLHREDGPVYQEWSKNGQKKDEWWYLNDKEYSRGEWVEKLKEIGSPHYREQKMLLDIEKYNI
jgi:hypothetical protein